MFRVIPELEAFLRSTDFARANVRKGIIEAGRANRPLQLWRAPDGTFVLVDGHTRYRVCEELGLPFDIEFVDALDGVSDLEDVKRWMLGNQVQRRNLTPDQDLILHLRAGFDVSKRFAPLSVSNARALLARAPDLADEVANGDMRLMGAWNALQRREGKRTAPRPRPAPAPASAPKLDDLEEHRLKTKLSSAESDKRDVLRRLADAHDQIELLKCARAVAPLKPIVLPKRQPGSTQRRGVPVMLCSDWHVEEPVDPKTVNGLNEFNLGIAESCIDRMAEAFEWLSIDARYDCRSAVVWLGGDLFSGYIHEELVEKNFLSPMQATAWLLPRVEKMLRTIAARCPQFERILVPCNDGNHGRTTDKIRVSTRTANSLEWLLYHVLANRLSDDPRFELHVAEGEWTHLEVAGKHLAFTHGDSFRYQGGVGGISIPLRRGMNEMRKYQRIDYVSLGHFHQRCDFGDIAVNGSMIGVSPYSMRIHAPPEPRQQSWFMIDEERGKCLSAPIWL